MKSTFSTEGQKGTQEDFSNWDQDLNKPEVFLGNLGDQEIHISEANQDLYNLRDKWLNAEIGILSLDVVNLYPSIPLWEGIRKIILFLQDQKNTLNG